MDEVGVVMIPLRPRAKAACAMSIPATRHDICSQEADEQKRKLCEVAKRQRVRVVVLGAWSLVGCGYLETLMCDSVGGTVGTRGRVEKIDYYQ